MTDDACVNCGQSGGWCGWNDKNGYSRICDACGNDYDKNIGKSKEEIKHDLEYWKKQDAEINASRIEITKGEI